MARQFIAGIPRKPPLRRETYRIPSPYQEAYCSAGVTDPDEQMMLFHVTQFGGFRLRRVPEGMRFDGDFRDRWLTHKFQDGSRHFKANSAFLRAFGSIAIEPLEKIWRGNVLSKKDMDECGFSPEEIVDARAFLGQLNDFYAEIRLKVAWPSSGITAEDRVQLSRFHGIPFLVKKPRAGGRFFHPETSYQRISPSIRQQMSINGEPTAEIDLSAAVLQFLNIALKSRSMASIDDCVLGGDPYTYFLGRMNSQAFLDEFREREMDRDTLKEVLYTAIYSPESKRSAAVNRKLRLLRRNYTHADLDSEFPSFFGALRALASKTESPLHMAINREESKYTQALLTACCLEQHLPVLAIHDSFITTRTNADILGCTMDEVATELYGTPLLHVRKY